MGHPSFYESHSTQEGTGVYDTGGHQPSSPARVRADPNAKPEGRAPPGDIGRPSTSSFYVRRNKGHHQSDIYLSSGRGRDDVLHANGRCTTTLTHLPIATFIDLWTATLPRHDRPWWNRMDIRVLLDTLKRHTLSALPQRPESSRSGSSRWCTP